MPNPLKFHELARAVVRETQAAAGGPPEVEGIRQVNVVAHVSKREGVPSRWEGYAAPVRNHRKEKLRKPMQERSAVRTNRERPCTMLVFNETDPDSGVSAPASTIVAGASAVPAAIEAVLTQKCRHPNEVVAVFNNVLTGRIKSEGFTLDALRKHPQAIVTKKFPGAVCAPARAIIRR
jgi:hypothetical protein